jgi:hypothetical protein
MLILCHILFQEISVHPHEPGFLLDGFQTARRFLSEMSTEGRYVIVLLSELPLRIFADSL